MSESLDVTQWAKAWEALARQAQSAFSAKPEPTVAGVEMPPWLENLQQANPFAKGKVQSEAVEHLLAGAQGYLGMLQSLANSATGQLPGGMAGLWSNSGFPGAFAAQAGNPFAQAMRGFGGQGAAGFEQLFDRFAQAAGPMLEKGKSVLNLPAFGHLREKQENLQRTARAFMEYQEQSARYDRLMLKVGEQSFARFQLKLAEREEPGRQIESVRALYDLWIDAAEEAYAEIALSEEFREVYAGVVDAQMRVRKQVQGDIEKLCNEMGMPTRSEVDNIGERLQALRREFREMKETQGSASASPPAPDVAQAVRVEARTASRPSAPVGKPSRSRRRKSISTKADASGSKSSAAASKPKAKPAAKPVKGTEASVSPHRRSKSPSRRKNASGKAPGKRAAASRVAAPSARTAKGSFAASIARFARKTKGAAKRGGSK